MGRRTIASQASIKSVGQARQICQRRARALLKRKHRKYMQDCSAIAKVSVFARTGSWVPSSKAIAVCVSKVHTEAGHTSSPVRASVSAVTEGGTKGAQPASSHKEQAFFVSVPHQQPEQRRQSIYIFARTLRPGDINVSNGLGLQIGPIIYSLDTCQWRWS